MLVRGGFFFMKGMSGMRNDDGCWVMGGVILLVIVVSFCGLAFSEGRISSRAEMQQEAIDHNCAEWRIDPKTGEREFVWLGTKVEKEGE